MVAAPLPPLVNFSGDFKISDQNNWEGGIWAKTKIWEGT